MKITNISCSCGNTTAFEHSHNLVECTACSTMIHVDTPVYHTYEVEPLHVIEQRAKEQAIIDMWLDDMPYIDWSTCFDVQSIKEDFTDVIRMVEVDKKRFDNYNTDHLPF